jgi:uncharacterized membrane protein
VPLLSRGYWHLALVALLFEIFSCWKILSLSGGFLVAGHFLFCLTGAYPAFSW